MELYRDVVFKRNVFGWEEHARVQLYTTYLKQLPFYVVYVVHNSEEGALDAKEHGHWFLDPHNAAMFVDQFATAFRNNQEFIPSIDMTSEVLDALRDSSVHADAEQMYRVVFVDPESDMLVSAMGSMAWNIHHPWFVSTESGDVARHCIYTENVAMCVARMNATIRIKGYVNDRVMGCSDCARFIVESAPYDPTGVSDEWTVVEEFPVFNQRVVIDFNESATELEYRYLTESELSSFVIKDERILNILGLTKERN